MADISTETEKILESPSGETVRDSIVSACRKIAANKLPVVTAADSGKILTVDETGAWEVCEWQT